MTALAHIQKGRTLMPRRVMLYGVHGVGKSTFGAMADGPWRPFPGIPASPFPH